MASTITKYNAREMMLAFAEFSIELFGDNCFLTSPVLVSRFLDQYTSIGPAGPNFEKINFKCNSITYNIDNGDDDSIYNTFCSIFQGKVIKRETAMAYFAMIELLKENFEESFEENCENFVKELDLNEIPRDCCYDYGIDIERRLKLEHFYKLARFVQKVSETINDETRESLIRIMKLYCD